MIGRLLFKSRMCFSMYINNYVMETNQISNREETEALLESIGMKFTVSSVYLIYQDC